MANSTEPASFAGNAQFTALLNRLPPESLTRQLLVIERDLAGQAGSVTDLSNTAEASAPGTASRLPRRARRYRRLPRGMPELLATPGPLGRTLEAWCPYCRTHHTHGRHGHPDDCARLGGGPCGCGLHADLHGFRGRCTCPPGSGDGHRGAHCADPESPFKATGYHLSEVIT